LSSEDVPIEVSEETLWEEMSVDSARDAGGRVDDDDFMEETDDEKSSSNHYGEETVTETETEIIIEQVLVPAKQKKKSDNTAMPVHKIVSPTLDVIQDLTVNPLPLRRVSSLPIIPELSFGEQILRDRLSSKYWKKRRMSDIEKGGDGTCGGRLPKIQALETDNEGEWRDVWWDCKDQD
jgi:hypothetical protein